MIAQYLWYYSCNQSTAHYLYQIIKRIERLQFPEKNDASVMSNNIIIVLATITNFLGMNIYNDDKIIGWSLQ